MALGLYLLTSVIDSVKIFPGDYEDSHFTAALQKAGKALGFGNFQFLGSNIALFRGLPRLKTKRSYHHQRMATLFKWLGKPCIDTTIGHDGENETERSTSGLHYFTGHLLYFMKAAEIKYRRTLRRT